MLPEGTMLVSVAVVAFLATVSAIPMSVVEKAMKDFNLEFFQGVLTPAAQQKIQELIKTNLEARKTRFWNLSRKSKLNTTLAAKIEVNQKLQELPLLKTENPTDAKVGIFEINDAEGISEYLFQGDLDLTEEQLSEIEQESSSRQKRQVSSFARKWAENTLNYYFDPSLNSEARAATTSALNYLSSHTCLRFVQSSNARNRVRVIPGSGCSSALGMRGGEQQISLGSGCEHVGTAAHEFMHALGLYHTQQRPERNSYISINTAVIDSDKLYNFNQMSSRESISYVPYEYGSVMHYDATSFSRGGAISMVAKDKRYTYTMGSPLVSFRDLMVINEHYACDDLCPAASSARCKNGGTPNPRNCAICNCPLGYGGALCDQRPSGCGETLTATSEWKTKQYTHGDSNNRNLRTDFDFCNQWITVPVGQKIQVKITAIYNGQCNYGCPFNGIEVKIGNQTETNPRYCCPESINKELTSELNPTPIISYNTYYYSSFTIQYRAIGTPSPNPGPSPSPSPAPAPTAGDCKDNIEYCPSWAERGYCTNPFYTPETRAQNCPKSCNVCKTGPPRPPTTTTPAPKQESCSDASIYCSTWARQGFCTHPFYTPGVRKQYCERTCGICRTEPPRPVRICRDAYNCSDLVNSGFCTSNFSRQTKEAYCAASCGFC